LSEYVAFFDLDHTIFTVNSGKILVECAHKRRLIRLRKIILAYLFSLLFRSGLLGAEFIMQQLTVWLKGISEDKFAAFAEELFDKYLRKTIRSEAKCEIDIHRKNGARLVILSAATDYICKPVKEFLSFDDILCSRMDVADGQFTGRPAGAYCYGDEKLNKIIEYCKSNHFDLGKAYYYADSYSDLNVLKAVGNPVCVSPDRKLKKIAQKEGWRISIW
jgi:HAD superfamily hydrolase (TIGR01490 family)